MTLQNSWIGRGCAKRWVAGVLLTGAAFSQSLSPVTAGDYSTGVSKEGATNWQWWHSLWFQKDGNPRYAGGSGNLSRNHQQRLPVRPPLCEPEYGYFQPCWRQLPVNQRCFTCESVPENYALPAYETVPSPMPPGPSALPPTIPGTPLPPVPMGAPPVVPTQPMGIGAAAVTDFPLPANR